MNDQQITGLAEDLRAYAEAVRMHNLLRSHALPVLGALIVDRYSGDKDEKLSSGLQLAIRVEDRLNVALGQYKEICEYSTRTCELRLELEHRVELVDVRHLLEIQGAPLYLNDASVSRALFGHEQGVFAAKDVTISSSLEKMVRALAVHPHVDRMYGCKPVATLECLRIEQKGNTFVLDQKHPVGVCGYMLLTLPLPASFKGESATRVEDFEFSGVASVHNATSECISSLFCYAGMPAKTPAPKSGFRISLLFSLSRYLPASVSAAAAVAKTIPVFKDVPQLGPLTFDNKDGEDDDQFHWSLGLRSEPLVRPPFFPPNAARAFALGVACASMENDIAGFVEGTTNRSRDSAGVLFPLDCFVPVIEDGTACNAISVIAGSLLRSTQFRTRPVRALVDEHEYSETAARFDSDACSVVGLVTLADNSSREVVQRWLPKGLHFATFTEIPSLHWLDGVSGVDRSRRTKAVLAVVLSPLRLPEVRMWKVGDKRKPTFTAIKPHETAAAPAETREPVATPPQPLQPAADAALPSLGTLIDMIQAEDERVATKRPRL